MMNGDFMAVPIEDTIIAYLDGRLNDSEGAELLHRVSVSPEIRQVFQEHEALRQVAFRAARNVSVPPHLEESVFARVAALEEKRDVAVPVGFWSLPKISAMAGAAAILALALLAPWQTSNTIATSNHSVITASQPLSPVVMAPAPSDLNSSGSAINVLSANPKVTAYRNTVSKSTSVSSINLFANDVPAVPQSSQSESEQVIQIIPKPAEVDHINMPLVSNPPQTLRSLSGLPDPDDAPMFEIGLATEAMPGFNAPADVISQSQPIADLATEFALRVGFNFDARNQIGLRFTRVGFPNLSVVSNSIANLGYAVSNGSFESQVGYAGELFYKHREPIDGGLFYVSGSVGGGIYSLGTLLSCELGLEIPVSEKLMGGVSVILSRLHQNGSDFDNVSGNEPVIYEGPNVYNTLAGRMEYGLSYRF